MMPVSGVRPAMRRLALPALAIGLMALTGLPARGEGEEAPAVARGVQYLRSQRPIDAGEAALAALAMVKSGVPADDPELARMMQVVRTTVNGSLYVPQRSGGTDLYEAGVASMLLVNLDPVSYRPQIDALAAFLIGRQKANGAWDYTHRAGDTGDCSISQYALLGLWEADSAGATVPPRVWDKAAAWYISVQEGNGAWRYHPDEPGPIGVSMTAAGVGSLLLCKRQLAQGAAASGGDSGSNLLVPLVGGPGASGPYKRQTSDRAIDAAVQKGLAWLGANFNPANKAAMGQSVTYGLYGIERLGALAGRQTLGRSDWFATGLAWVAANQQPGGNWSGQHGDLANTAWAVLFMTRSTAKTVERIRVQRLGAGTLVGGRDLPKDLSNLSVAGGRVLVRPMNGAVEAMISVLEDPRAQSAESALAGLVERYRAGGPEVLRPHLARFTRMLADPDQGVRAVAAWALGRAGDLDAVPPLLGALEDPDDDVVAAARVSLQLLARKLDGFGPPPGATAAQKREAVARWNAWYEEARRPDFARQLEADRVGTGRARGGSR